MKALRNYVIAAYLVFWFMVLGLCGSTSMVFHCPPVVMRILSNICAWSPTIVLLAGFRYFVPGKSIGGFYRKAFGGGFTSFSLAAACLLTLFATLISVLILSLIEGRPFSSYWSLDSYPFWASLLFSITSGPSGEESGWRGFLPPLPPPHFSCFPIKKNCDFP